MKSTLSLIVAICLACIDVHSSPISHDVQCYIDHLKKNHLWENAFPTQDKLMEKNCEESVKTFIDATYKNAEMELHRDESFDDKTAKCIMERLHHHHFADHKMLEKVYELSHKMMEEKLSHEEIMMKISNAEKATKVGKVSGVQHCITEKTLGAQFDMFLNHPKDTDDFEVYCKRKYVTEHDLIDRDIYHFEINEKNMNFKDKNCDKAIKAAGAKFEERLAEFLKKGEDKHDNTEEESECIKKIHLDGKFFDITLVVDVLAELHLNDEQMKVERMRFVEAMGAISGASMRCVVPKH